MTIGGSPEYNTSRGFNGYISNVRVIPGTAMYTSNFTPTTTPVSATANTALLLNASTGVSVYDASCNFDLLPSGTPRSSTTVKKFNGSVAFNGSTDYFTIPDSNLLAFGSSNFTIEAWVKTSTASTADASCILSQSIAAATSDSSFFFGVGTNAGLWISSGTGWTYSVTSTGVNVADGSWHHVAVVRNGTSIVMYVDGVSKGTTTLSAGFTLGNSTRVVTIGCQNGTGAFFSGNVEDLRVSNGVAVYTTNFTVPAAAFTA